MTARPVDPDRTCICPYTPESTWLSAASCGYGSGYEPGSMQEWDPDCPMHRRCAECGDFTEVVEEFDDQIGFEEQARPVVVTVLACGHEVVRPGRWDPR